MMEEVATVIRCNDNGWITVEVKVKNACNHCDSNESCGTSAVSKAFSPKVQRFAIPADGEFQEGEMLKLGLPESVILKAAALVYLLPLLGLFIGAGFGHFLMGLIGVASADLGTMAFALLGAVTAWFFGKAWARRLEQNSLPVIISRLGQPIVTSTP
ncbi:SoxR reducing system RseC family protein [Shewanella sp. AS1]|uniref:SoxR reducing system RseC family protein n=1 Tax=Shewanella sp. AS1 TaxID=2907626 RepID=UPI001F18C0A5|nr:SoxR reducing system RseC family protein [Shewanella sp. AS1]MCE9679061.1 SoxR reducing system RseC family protein [Shewanella sp. AS1]